jgi:peptidoglycan/LPS O-acetylase OafA/YrhL
VTPTSAYQQYQDTRFFASLDGLRTLSILGVIWHHTAGAGATWSLLHRGNRGVDLFFVISGFLIVTLLLRAKAAQGTFSLPKFWGRRSLRILPVYYAVLGLYAALVYWLERNPVDRQAFFDHLPAFATFTSNWFVNLDNPRVIFYFAWSLAAEEQFYLFWPWCERYLRGWWPLLAASLALVLTQGWSMAVASLPPDQLPFPMRMLTSVPAAILLGVILAHLLHTARGFRLMQVLSGQRGSALGALALCALTLYLTPMWGAAADLIIAGALLLLVSACVIRPDHDLAQILTLRPVAWIGRISYGMYLFHMLGVNVIRRVLAAASYSSAYLDFIGGTLVAILLAALSYRYFESYFLRLKNRFFREDSRVTLPPVASA